MPQVPGRSRASGRPQRAGSLVAVVSLACLVPVLAAAQTAGAVTTVTVGQNINMVGGPAEWFPATNTVVGDPFLQRQNEPSLAVSTRNHCHLLAGANDYRTVDLPQVEEGAGERGDAWLGVFTSLDCGATWTSTLLPGYAQDLSPEGQASPIRGLAAGADPTVRAGTSGMFYMSGIAFNRGTNEPGRVFVSRFVDRNNVEGGNPFAYLGTKVVDNGNSGQFLDKPWIATGLPSGTATCSVDGQTIAAGPVYLVYTAFVGGSNNPRSKILFSKSVDCGQTWTNPSKLSERIALNQGTTMAVSPVDGTIYIAWREFDGGKGYPDSILMTWSKDGGKSFQPARRIIDLSGSQQGPYAGVRPFDQGSTPLTFRTNAFPTLAIDAAGRLYVAVAARGYVPLRSGQTRGDARIILTTSTNGTQWTMPYAVDPHPRSGHQVMPALSFAGGKLALAYYDFRDNVSGLNEDFVVEGGFVAAAPRRHSVDLRAAMAEPAPLPQFTNFSVLDLGPDGGGAKVSRYIEGLRTPGTASLPLQFNLLNLPLFSKGQFPFLGDYIDIAAVTFLPDGRGGWVFNTGTTANRPAPQFHVAWADNRDVRRPKDGNWANYTPRVVGPGGLVCQEGQAGVRNQNVYTAQLKPGLILTAPTNAKRVSSFQRSFVVFAQNTTTEERTYQLAITRQANVVASFDQFGGFGVGAPVETLTLTIPRRSTASRTVFVALDAGLDPATAPHVTVPVTVTEIGGSQLADVVFLNPDFDNPDFDNPDFDNAELHNPDFDNPDFDNFALNTAVRNPDFDNPDFDNPDFDNPDFDNPDFDNPDFDNPDFDNAAISDLTWRVKNDGNTSSAYKINLFLKSASRSAGYQLVVRRVYVQPSVSPTCAPQQTAQNQAVLNIVAPRLDAPLRDRNFNDPARTNATFPMAPGEEFRVTLRSYCKAGTPASECALPTLGDVSLAVVAQAANCVVCEGAACNTADLVAGATECRLEDDLPTKDIYDPIPPDVSVSPTSPVVSDTPTLGYGREPVTFTVLATDNLGIDGVTCTAAGLDLLEPVAGNGVAGLYSFTGSFPLGTTEVTCTATDAGAPGNAATTAFAVEVRDTTPPEFTAGQQVVTSPSSPAEATGPMGTVVSFATPVATDPNGTSVTVGCSPASGAWFAVGTTAVVCVATDAAGNATAPTPFATVVVRDTTAPSMSPVTNVSADAGTSAAVPVVFAVPTASDLVSGVVPVTCAPAAGSMFPVGTTTVVCSASDTASPANVATTSFLVTVTDTAAPVFAPDQQVVTSPALPAEATGPGGAVVTFSAPVASDPNGGAVTVVCQPPSGSLFPVGTTPVFCTATDAAGNTSQSITYVTVVVRDSVAPVISAVSDLVIDTRQPAGEAISYAMPSATDVVSGPVPVSCTPAPGSVFAVGTTQVVCTATDGAGNTATRSFSVTLRLIDSTPPVTLTATANPLLLWPPDGTYVTVTVSGVAVDNAGGSGIARVEYSVVDEYRQVQPSGSIAATDGPYSLGIRLLRDRKGNDKDGRHYSITIRAVDKAGNVTAFASPIVINVHDRSGS